MRIFVRILSLLPLIIPTTLFSHGGGLNAEGCHHNRKTGDYHCHRSSYRPAPTTPASGWKNLSDPIECIESELRTKAR
ncbi:MAG: YHYH domain-containing protein [Thiothrix sp.]|nr:MAG: YHYH domain-containing protein [Thiothrix sp.]